MQEQITTYEAATLLGKSTHWLYVNAERLQIPRYRIGGRWVYLESEISEWFNQQKIMQENPDSQLLRRSLKRKMHVEFR